MKDMGQGDSRGKALALLLALVPLLVAATMGMAPILAAKKCLLLACFQEQTAPLKAIFAKGAPTPFLPAFDPVMTIVGGRILWRKEITR